MFKKIFTFMFAFLMFVLIEYNISQAQPTKTTGDTYPVFSIAPMGGVQFPLGDLNNSYSASFNVGLDLNLKINRETSFFLYGGYNDMPAKFDGPDASIIHICVGPRYIFSSKAIKAQFFLEAGVGVYIFGTKEYTIAGTPSITIPSESTSNFGINVGPGVIIPLGKAADLIMKTKLNYMFQEGGAQTYIGALLGIDFKL